MSATVEKVEKRLRESLDLAKSLGVKILDEQWFDVSSNGRIEACCALGSAILGEPDLDRCLYVDIAARKLGIDLARADEIMRGFDGWNIGQEPNLRDWFALGARLRRDYLGKEALAT